MRLGRMHLVVLPAQTLCDAQASPLVFPQQLEGASRAVKVVLGDGLEHLLGELNVTVLVVIIVVPARTHVIVSRRGFLLRRVKSMSMLAIFAVQCDVMVWCDAKGGRVLFDGETPRGDVGTEGCDGVVSREAVQREGRCCLFGSRGCDDWQRLEGSGGGEVGLVCRRGRASVESG